MYPETFWRVMAASGLALLLAIVGLQVAILFRMPPAIVTYGAWKHAGANPKARMALREQMPVDVSLSTIENAPTLDVKVEDEPVEVRIVR